MTSVSIALIRLTLTGDLTCLTLAVMPIARNQPPSSEPLFDVPGLSAYLGGIPVQTLYKWRASRPRKGPRAVRIGRHLRYRKTDVDRWLDSLADPIK
jgi:predicted DNA-binding transcriptional regulator AlpA